MGDVLSKLTDPLVDGAKSLLVHHLSYLIYVTQNVKDLRDTMNVLKAKREDIQQKFALGERESTRPTQEATTWLARVEAIEGEAAAIGDAFDNRSCMCVGGCSLNCWSNYRIGRRAAKKLVEAKGLLDVVPSVENITMAVLPPPAQEIPTTSSPVSAGLLQSNVDKALSYLRDDDNKAATVMGIWGMGGVGKTTLLTEINNSLARDPHNNLFHVVIFVTASRGCTVEMLQEKIVKNLKLGETAGDATSIIYNFLSNKNFVLLLDDLWDYLDLSKAGIPQPLGKEKRRKVILTTRSQDMCAKMGAISRMRIKVECLNQADALKLFRENVTEEVIGSHPDIPPLAKKVAEECRGLPLALITIGRAMSNMTSPQEWNYALSSLQKSRPIPGIDDDQKKLFTLLKHSYDYLRGDRIRECFLYCSLWPEDYVIKNKELIDLWMGHGLLEDNGVHGSIEDLYNSGRFIIERLKAACLLELVEYENYDCVKMHDVLRDMASWIVETDKGEKWVTGKAPEVIGWSEVNKAFVEEFDWSTTQPSSAVTIFTNSPKLSTLIFNFYKFDPRMGFFRDIQVFSELKYLQVSNRTSGEMTFFPVEICGLLKLEYLDLSGTEIQSLPKELSHLRNLKYLILRSTLITTLPQGLLSNLEKLRVLDMYSGYEQVALDSSSIEQVATAAHGGRGQSLISIGVNVSALSDVQRLTQYSRMPIRSLGMVRLELGSDSLHLLSPALFGSHSPMRSTLKELTISFCKGLHHLMILAEDESQSHHNRHHHPSSTTISLSLERLRLRRMSNLKDIIWEGVSPAELFQKLRDIHITNCSGLKHVTWVLHLPCLERLHLWSCRSMKHIIELDRAAIAVAADETSSNQQTGAPAAFPRLRMFLFADLPAFVSICNPHHFTFPSLEIIFVIECPMLKRLPSQLPSTSTKLKEILGEQEWWDRLEDDSIRSSLSPFYRQIRYEYGRH